MADKPQDNWRDNARSAREQAQADLLEGLAREAEFDARDRALAEARGPEALARWEVFCARLSNCLNRPEFTRSEVSAICGVPPHLIKNAIDRNIVVPSGAINTGKGNHRKFNVFDVVTFAFLGEISKFGLRHSIIIDEPRLIGMICGRVFDLSIEEKPSDWKNGGGVAFYVAEDDKITPQPFYEDRPNFESLPECTTVLILRLDQMIERVFAGIEKIRPEMTTNRESGNFKEVLNPQDS